MANGLITSFFTTSTSSRVEQTTEGEGPARKIPFDGVSDNGLTLDLGGFLCSDSMEVQPKGRKKKKRKRGHVHLARLSEDDNYVAIEQNEDDVLCEEVTIVDPDEEGVVWLSPLKQKAPLSLPWQHVFRHTQRKSPVKKTASSPKRCRSPRQPTQVKQSPSEQAVKRQLLSTPGNSRIACLPVDYAPYTGLVHVQQRQQQGAGGGHTATANSSIVPLSFRLPLRAEPQSCPTTVGATWSLESGDCHPVSPTMPSFEPVTDRLAACLDQMERESPHLNVSDIYSRYSSLTKRSHRLPDSDSLTCSITVRVSDDRVTVDPSAYPRDAELHDHMHSDLWSVIYRPRRSSEVIGNSAPCSSLCTWLNRWKAERSTGEAAGSRKGAETDLRHRSKLHNSNGWWMSDRDDDFIPPDQSRPRKKSGLAQRYLDGDIDAVSTEEEDLCSVMLLCGPPGSGKTAAVYACAEELGFGVSSYSDYSHHPC